MIDINAIITQALTAAVAEATKPLVARIAALENVVAEYGVTAPIVARLNALDAALAARPAPQVDEAVFTYLDDSEAFWHRIAEFVNARTSIVVEQIVANAIDAHTEEESHISEDDIDSKIEEAIEKHEEESTHGDEDDVETLVRKLLRNASIDISI